MDNDEQHETPQATAKIPSLDGAETEPAAAGCTASNAAADSGCVVIKDTPKPGFHQIVPEPPSHPSGKA